MTTVDNWLCPGASVEVTMQEEGLVGMKATAKVLAVSGKKVHIEHSAFQDDKDESKQLCEWVPLAILTPPPPPPPAGFHASLAVGAPVEVYFEDGWWAVTLLKKPKGGGENGKGPSFLVGSAMYRTERWAEIDCLRPSWKFFGGHWQAEQTVVPAPAAAARKAGGKSKAAPPAPPAESSAKGAKKARSSGGGGSGGGSGASSGGRGGGGGGRGGGGAVAAKRSPKTPAASSSIKQPQPRKTGADGSSSGAGGTAATAAPVPITDWTDMRASVTRLLNAPAATGPGGTWQPDGVSATIDRLMLLRAKA